MKEHPVAVVGIVATLGIVSMAVGIIAGQVLKLAVWSCGDSFTDERDGTSYATVRIGTQCWMAENLNYGRRVDGSREQKNNGVVEKYCYSDYDTNCTTYGGLYQWDEAMDYSSSCNGTGQGNEACSTPVRGICPEGWHIPSHYEFVALERAVCTSDTCDSDFPYDTSTFGWRGTNEGTSLKQNGGSGFEVLFAGVRYRLGFFGDFGSDGVFWSATELGSRAWRPGLDSKHTAVSRFADGKAFGFSVRCLQD